MRAIILMARRPNLLELFFWKFEAKPAAATMSIMTYCTMVMLLDAQNESCAGSLSVRLHCSMLTAYFWKGKIAL